MTVAQKCSENSLASVLIVDDNPTHMQIYAWIVERSGYVPLLAPVRFEGVEFPEEIPDLVLLDYHLGGLTSAVDVARLMLEKQPAIPIVVLSDAHEMPEDIAPFVNGFVRKGNPERLTAVLQEFLRHSALQHASQPHSSQP